MGGKGSGAKPKRYDPLMVAEVERLYAGGMTQVEVATALGTTQKVVWRLMQRHGIPSRVAAKRDQAGPKNHAWKGEEAGYQAMHLRVTRLRGTPSSCEHCGTTDASRFEWASKTGNYADPYDYIRLCASCHHTMDGTIVNIEHMRARMTGGSP